MSDLNLYRLLLTVYQTGSVTEAASALHLTQPAVSHGLKRAREQFQDALFERIGRRLQPTARLTAMMPTIERAVADLEALSATPKPFALAEQRREVRIGLRDILEIPLVDALYAAMAKHAPGLTLKSQQWPLRDLAKPFQDNRVDIVVDALAPTDATLHSEPLFDEPFVVLCRPDHPYARNPDLATYLAHPHLVVSLHASDLNLVDLALAKKDAHRNIAVYCEHYVAGVRCADANNLLMTLPRYAAQSLAVETALKIYPSPLTLPDIPVALYWHQRSEHDPVIAWVRDEIRRWVAEVFNKGEGR